jgi:Ca2+-transporting ATPase
VALFPLQLLFCKFFVVVAVVIGFIVDVPDPDVMNQPPRDPGTRIVTRPQIIRWAITGFVVAVSALAVLVWGPDKPSTTHPSISMTMAFAIVAFSAVNLGLVMRREREWPWSRPVFPYLGCIIAGWLLTWAAVELNMLQRLLDTESLSGGQWGIVLALSLLAPAIVGADMVVQRRRQNKRRAAHARPVSVDSRLQSTPS